VREVIDRSAGIQMPHVSQRTSFWGEALRCLGWEESVCWNCRIVWRKSLTRLM